MMSMTVIVGILNDSVPKSSDLSRLGYFVFFDIILICGAVVVILLCHNLRVVMRKMAKEKLGGSRKNEIPWSGWLIVLRLTRNSAIARLSLFVVFVILHTINLVILLGKPRAAREFEALTHVFNVTSS
ncbi:hypothetical protein PFISCL1PPCAC_27453 [Pristionchus fissidentatus]|uniref:Ion channel n=1 Tax=Pristionchus fissidentatus TaxID=1538716 RepID=A0AAV5WYC3_9BILA|nr:hypothetical protein PFISCL1PPCAC_27453 [Pristionchus fissidentatus]